MRTLSLLFLSCICLMADPLTKKFSYLLSQGQINQCINLYLKEGGSTHYELLDKLAKKILERSLSSEDAEEHLISLFSHSIANVPVPLHILDAKLSSPAPYEQSVGLYLLGNRFEDKVEPIIAKGLSSMFLPIRMQALYFLALRKSPILVGQVESLQNLLPPEYEGIFADLLAIQGTPEAITKIRHLITHKIEQVKLSAIRAGGAFHIDELLPVIRPFLDDPSQRTKEVALFSLGEMADLKEKDKVILALDHPNPLIRLAGALSLKKLNIETEKLGKVCKTLEKDKNLYYIAHYPELSQEPAFLADSLSDTDDNVRLNAALSLLKLKHPASVPVIRDIIFCDPSAVHFKPHYSPGGVLSYIEVLPSASTLSGEERSMLTRYTEGFLMQVASASLELPEPSFLFLAEKIYQAGRHPLTRLFIQLLEQKKSEECKKMLERFAGKIGDPIARRFAKLALYRLSDDAASDLRFISWLEKQEPAQMMQFCEAPSPQERYKSRDILIQPEEEIAFFIEAYETIALHREPKTIPILLHAISHGHLKNRPIFAALLLKTIQ